MSCRSCCSAPGPSPDTCTCSRTLATWRAKSPSLPVILAASLSLFTSNWCVCCRSRIASCAGSTQHAIQHAMSDRTASATSNVNAPAATLMKYPKTIAPALFQQHLAAGAAARPFESSRWRAKHRAPRCLHRHVRSAADMRNGSCRCNAAATIPLVSLPPTQRARRGVAWCQRLKWS